MQKINFSLVFTCFWKILEMMQLFLVTGGGIKIFFFITRLKFYPAEHKLTVRVPQSGFNILFNQSLHNSFAFVFYQLIGLDFKQFSHFY